MTGVRCFEHKKEKYRHLWLKIINAPMKQREDRPDFTFLKNLMNRLFRINTQRPT